MSSIDGLLASSLEGLGISCTPQQRSLLIQHLELVIDKNRELNLTRIDSLESGVYLHIIDSLLCADFLSKQEAPIRMLDIGTGGGFPGIPLSIVTGADTLLIDSIQKKVDAVDRFIKVLEIEDRCKVVCVRAEELAKHNPNSFDVVVARAVAQTNVLVEYTSPLLKFGGFLCAMKANISSEELAAAEKAADICGMKIVSRETFELPNDSGHREILYIEKAEEASIELPRRIGMAAKRPLGLK